jgi:hypothetical protein
VWKRETRRTDAAKTGIDLTSHAASSCSMTL